jgi:hypothetical protein
VREPSQITALSFSEIHVRIVLRLEL